MSRSNRARRFQALHEPSCEREALERRWRGRISVDARLATLVVSQGCAREPFHRWLPYRQGFSPGLVRLFLTENRLSAGDGPVLDPFSGAGTTITECARQRIPAVGVEALPALVFLANAKFAQSWTQLPPLQAEFSCEEIARRLESPLHRAALMIAEARRRTGTGAVNRTAPSIFNSLIAVSQMMHDDLTHPLAIVNEARPGDARSLDLLDTASVGAILTSPPYLSHYDYTQVNDASGCVYQLWYKTEAQAANKRQLRAVPRSRSGRTGKIATHAAVNEAYHVLEEAGWERQAQSVLAYFADMLSSLESAYRVLRPGSPAWLVVGGARIKDVYIPSDLILAELAETIGLSVEGVHTARELHPARRKLGHAGYVAPRESVLQLRKP